MFKEMFRFEMQYRLRQISTWIYFASFFVLGFVMMLAIGGTFTGVEVSMGASEKIFMNSPYMVYQIFAGISIISIFLISSFFASTIYKDFENKSFAIMFTKPITKFSYLFGRFFADSILLMFIFGALSLGLFSGSLMPWLNESLFGPYFLHTYLNPLVTQVLPNVIFLGSIFLILSILTRKTLPVYISGILVTIFYGFSSRLLGDMDNEFFAALLDPLGIGAYAVITKHWSIFEKNNSMIVLKDLMLYNRIIWLGISTSILAFGYKKFDMQFFLSEKVKKKSLDTNVDNPKTTMIFPKQSFNFVTSFKQMLGFAKIEIKEILTSPLFIILSICTLLVMIPSIRESGKIMGTPTLPITYNVFLTISGVMQMLSLIVILVFTGELVWKERENKIDLLIDSTPIKGWVNYVSKFIAVGFLPIVLLVVGIIGGAVYQLANGFTNIEFLLYAKLAGLQLFYYVFLIGFAFFIHSIVNNKYAAHFVVISIMIGKSYLYMLGIEQPIFNLGSGGSYQYSDMNGFGDFLPRFFAYKFYWGFLALFLVFVSYMYKIRGSETSLRVRSILVKDKLRFKHVFVGSFLLAGFFGFGYYIWYQTNVVRDFTSMKESTNQAIQYEKKYKKYKDYPQPRVTDVLMNVDLFPDNGEVKSNSSMTIQNKTSVAISEFVIEAPCSISSLEIDLPVDFEIAINDSTYNFGVLKLAKPMKPSEVYKINFKVNHYKEGFHPNTTITKNGSFINSSYLLPTFGYSGRRELSSENKRKKYDLPPKERMANIDDIEARGNTYISSDSDWVNFECILSTNNDQIAVAPGYLQKKWLKNNRRYYHYKMDHKILKFFSFVSADYEVKSDKWISEEGKEVNLEIYYDEKHPYNVDRMLTSLKNSLTYFSKNFGEYPDRQVRILEFPRYSAFAQSFPNTIPFSEAIGFIADVKDGVNFDYAYNVTSHELAHQWWAHQVIGANVKGATLMSEALAQYGSLMVSRNEYGHHSMMDFVKRELNSYLRGRSNESRKENPLYLNENQQYLHYNKGSISMYALQEYIGEENVNNALKKYVTDKKYQEPLYTTSIEFIEYLRAETPDSLQYLITDMFEKITFYKNKISDVNYEKLENGKYELTIDLESSKSYADSLGIETNVEFNDWFEVGAFVKKDKKEKTIFLDKFQINDKDKSLKIIVEELPERVAIDPYRLVIDRDNKDNWFKLKKENS